MNTLLLERSLPCTSPREEHAKSHQGAVGAIMTALFPVALLTPQGWLYAADAIYTKAAGPNFDLCTYWGVVAPMPRPGDSHPMLYGWHRIAP
jgi:hypothetical protein